MNYKAYLLIIASLLMGCGSEEQTPSQTEDMTRQVHQAELTRVKTIDLQLVDFDKELISNGKLEASRKAKLTFSGSGVIEKLNVSEGSRVAKGAIIAQLENSQSQLDLEQAQLSFEKAQMDYADKLLDFGYSIEREGEVPQEMKTVAQIRSGYKDAQISLKKAERIHKDKVLTAPFGGKIATVKASLYEQPSGEVCTLVDDGVMKVKFTVLESEISFVKKGQEVEIIPFNDPGRNYTGRITNINPLVDEKGQIAITAQISNQGGKLIDGQNVKIFIKETLPSQMVVPKSAVVVRDKMNVLFLYRDGRTVWTYVDVLHANSDSYVVAPNTDRSSELNVGDQVIISGNLNIGDNVKVEIEN